MDTLRLVEVTPEGDLVLMTGDGRRFSLSVDEQVRSAVRRSRNGTHVAPTSDRPGPREVQSRIRAGADAEQVAQQTGLDVDYVRRFEGPVLAERAHVAELAQATAVDRGGDPTLTLERVVLDVLTGEGFDVDDISWDSRRSDGTRWEVVVVSVAGATRTRATWAFDTATRSLEPVDAEAERLTGVERRRRLSAVRDTVFDVERPAATAPRGGTVDLLDALARQRGRRPVPATASTSDDGAAPSEPAADRDRTRPDAASGTPAGRDDDAGTTDPVADEPAVDADASPTPGDGGTSDPAVRTAADGTTDDGDDTGSSGNSGNSDGDGDGDGDGQAAVVALGATRRARSEDGDREVGPEPDLLSELDLGRTGSPGSAPVRAAATTGDRRSRRARRSAVPSWDEIVFGAKREDG